MYSDILTYCHTKYVKKSRISCSVGAALASKALGSGAPTLEAGTSHPVEKARTGPSIPLPWASEWRGSLPWSCLHAGLLPRESDGISAGIWAAKPDLSVAYLVVMVL